MNDGHIEQEGPPLDIYQNPRSLFSATFIGTNNFLPGIVRETGAEIVVTVDELGLTFSTKKPDWTDFACGTPVWVCVRADDIDTIDEDRVSHYRNVITVDVDHASLTGSIVIIEGRLKDQPLRIHVGGGQRFGLLDSSGKTIRCGLSHIALIPRDDANALQALETMPASLQEMST
jgi:iron(III) transport system ATP-binding protein